MPFRVVAGRVHEETVKQAAEELPKITLKFGEVRNQLDRDLPDKIVSLIVKSGDRNKIEELNNAAGRIKSAARLDRDMAPYFFKNMNAESFVNSPGAYEKLAVAMETDSGTAFRAVCDRGSHLLKPFENNPEEIIEKFKDMRRAAGASYDVFRLLDDEKIAHIFLNEYDFFIAAIGSIKEAAGPDAGGAFWLLRNEEIKKIFFDDPDRLVEIFAELSKAARGKPERKGREREFSGSETVFGVLDKQDITQLFAANPDFFIRLARTSGEDAPGAFKVFHDSDYFKKLFSEKPELLLKISEKAGRHTSAVFGILETYWFSEMLKKNEDLLVRKIETIVKICGEKTSDILDEARYRGSGLELLAEAPEKFAKPLLEIYNFSHKSQGPAGVYHSCFGFLGDNKLRDAFKANPAYFVEFAESQEGYFPVSTDVLYADKVRALFEKDRAKVIKTIGEYRKTLGDNVYEIFYLIRGGGAIAQQFIDNPDELLKNLVSLNLRRTLDYEARFSPRIGDLLGSEKLAELFVKKPKTFIAGIARIREIMGDDAHEIYGVLSTNRLAELFIANPSQLMAKLSEAKKARTEDFPYVLDALGNDTMADMFLKNPRRFINLLQNALAGVHPTSKGHITSALGRYDKNENAARLFAARPEMMVELIKSIHFSTENDDILRVIAQDGIAEILLAKPQLFSSLVKLSSKSGGDGVMALGNTELQKMFIKDPERFMKLFLSIAENTGGSYHVFREFREHDIAEMFVAQPDAVVEITGQAKHNSGSALEMLKWNSKLFKKNPGIFTEMAGHARLDTAEAFAGFSGIGSLMKTETYMELVKLGGVPSAIKRGYISNVVTAMSQNENTKKKMSEGKAEEIAATVMAVMKLCDEKRLPDVLYALQESPVFADCPRLYLDVVRANPAAADWSLLSLNKLSEYGDIWKKSAFVLEKFARINKNRGNEAEPTYMALRKSWVLAKSFWSDADALIDKLAEVQAAAKTRPEVAMKALENDEIAKMVLGNIAGRESFDRLMLSIYASGNYAIETGRRLDELHDQPDKRIAYLNKLGTNEVFGLLLSDPEYFYTSTNHMLFDRLKKDLGAGSVGEVLAKAGMLDSTECRNFMFRALNYDRLYGRPDSLLNDRDLEMMIGALMVPLTKPVFDAKYYFLVANSIEHGIRVPAVRKRLEAVVGKRLTQIRSGQADVAKKQKETFERSLEYLCYLLDKDTAFVSARDKKRIEAGLRGEFFDPAAYRAADGKRLIIQIFDKNDTQKDHWILTQQWFNKGRTPQKKEGEIRIETPDTRIILFMGENEHKNQEFIDKQARENPGMILTFRGHSFSLYRNIPPGIFKNMDRKILFISGSCGSAGSTAEYISANPDTELVFISNTSTGRGQVTNAVVDGLINTRRKKSFVEIMRENSSKIEKQGGKTATLKVWMPGEALLHYVNSARE